ncbi:MAG: efflux RND transporter permease subunit [Gemmataceae bacterium]
MIRSAMNEGKSTPINVRVTAKSLEKAHEVAEAAARSEAGPRRGRLRILQRLNYPQYVVNVDRAKASDLGLTQIDVMKNLVAALSSSIQFNKKNFWIDPVSHNQYFVGVQYPEARIKSIDTLLDVPITGPVRKTPIPLRNIVSITRSDVPAEVNHTSLQATIDLTMGVYGRDLGSVADAVGRVVGRFGQPVRGRPGEWTPYDPASTSKKLLAGAKITLSGEYRRMQDTFRNLGVGLVLAGLLVYFLMVALFKSWLIPLVILAAVPVGLVGVIAVLFLTGTAINAAVAPGCHLHGRHRCIEYRITRGLRAESARQRAVVADGGDCQGGVGASGAGGDDGGTAAFFALLPMAAGLARKRGEHAARPGGDRRPAGRPGDHPVRRPGGVLAGGPRRAAAGGWPAGRMGDLSAERTPV